MNMTCAIVGTLLEKKIWNPFCPVFRTLGKRSSQKGSLHVQEPYKVPYMHVYNQK